MSWSISFTGSKEDCRSALAATAVPEDAGDAAQYEHMQAVVNEELDRYEDGSMGMSIHASGEAPGDAGGNRTFSIWISGKAARRFDTKPAPRAKETEAATKPAKTR